MPAFLCKNGRCYPYLIYSKTGSGQTLCRKPPIYRPLPQWEVRRSCAPGHTGGLFAGYSCPLQTGHWSPESLSSASGSDLLCRPLPVPGSAAYRNKTPRSRTVLVALQSAHPANDYLFRSGQRYKLSVCRPAGNCLWFYISVGTYYSPLSILLLLLYDFIPYNATTSAKCSAAF